MQRRNLILVGVAVVIGLFAVFLANSYFGGVEQQQQQVAAEQRLARIVVANQDMAFGSPLSDQNLRLANWPANSVPAGAFTSIADASRGGRVALRPMVVGEPVLASKVSGADGRATLSANLPKGMLAYSIPISDVAGVGGFVRPGDLVDVILTRPIPGDGANNATDKMTDVIIEAAPVLGIDQVADEKKTEATVAKTATLQVDAIGAQKLALGIQLGTLSLALRNVADQMVGATATVLPRNLSASGIAYRIPARNTAQPQAPAPAAPAPQRIATAAPTISLPVRPSGPSMIVVRGSQSSEYEVQRGY